MLILCVLEEGADAASEEVQRVKEHAIYKLGQLYIQYQYVQQRIEWEKFQVVADRAAVV